MTEWFENTHFWEELEPFLFTRLRTPHQTRKEVAGIVRLLNLKKGDRVLDLACGPGRITLPLAKFGFKMTGVDITQSYLAKLGRKASEKNLEIELIKEDMSRFSRPNGFDAVISIFSSFGYFSDEHKDQKTLKNVYDSLAPGGQFLLDVNGRETLKRHFREQTKYPSGDGTHVLEHVTIKPRWDWVQNKWTLIRGQHQKVYTLNIRIFSAKELEDALRKAGFSEINVYGNFNAIPYDKEAQRLILVCRK